LRRWLWSRRTKFYLVSGDSDGYTMLNAFDGALMQSGIGDTNLIRLSSILPPNAKRIDPIQPRPGSFLPVAYAARTSDIPGQVISASVAVGVPMDKNKAGLIMEYSDTLDEKDVHAKVRQMVLEGMKMRKREIFTIYSISATHLVENSGGVFAGVVLL
jgi:arginine decarboxylase